MITRRHFSVGAGAAALAGGAPALAQADWPSKPVSMVVPYPPGGLNDVVARAFADKLTGALGKSFIVDNKAGDRPPSSGPDGMLVQSWPLR